MHLRRGRHYQRRSLAALPLTPRTDFHRGYKRKNSLCVVQQYCPCPLASALTSIELNLTNCLCLIEELLELVVFLHSHAVVHTNITTSSLYVTDGHSLVLGHFRHALRLDKTMKIHAAELARLWHGPEALMPPEVCGAWGRGKGDGRRNCISGGLSGWRGRGVAKQRGPKAARTLWALGWKTTRIINVGVGVGAKGNLRCKLCNIL